MSRRRGDGGFTLIEVLVAVTVLALLMTFITQGLRLAWRTDAAASARLEATADVATAEAFLYRWLANALPLPSADGSDSVAFEGTQDSIAFVAPLPEPLGGTLYRFDVGIDTTAPDRPLVVLAAPLGEPTAVPERFVLVRHVRDLAFSYLGQLDPPLWQERWLGRPDLPRLVRIDARIDEPPRTVWPTVLVRPVIVPAYR